MGGKPISDLLEAKVATRKWQQWRVPVLELKHVPILMLVQVLEDGCPK